MASTIMAPTSRVLAAKTPFLGHPRPSNAPLRDIAAAATGRITMVRTHLLYYFQFKNITT
jgi:light-harvesting complex II chlorophyll a/b binding protein 3